MMRNEYEVRGNTVAIFLRQQSGVRETLIDAKDLPLLHALDVRWRVCPNGCGHLYAKAEKFASGKRQPITLHRFLIGHESHLHVDHRNGDTLDNRRANLRLVTSRANQLNRRGANRNSRTGVRGVSWHKRDKRFRAQIVVSGSHIYLGSFLSLEDAAAAYERAWKEQYIDVFNEMPMPV